MKVPPELHSDEDFVFEFESGRSSVTQDSRGEGTRKNFSARVGLLFGRLGVELVPLVISKAAEPGRLESVFFQYSRGTRGSSTAVSGGENYFVFRQLVDALLELRDRNIDVARARP